MASESDILHLVLAKESVGRGGANGACENMVHAFFESEFGPSQRFFAVSGVELHSQNR